MPIHVLPTACWRLVDPDGEDYPPDPGPSHYDTRAAASAASEPYWSDVTLTPAPFGRPCALIVCDSCGADPDDDEFAHVHFPDEATAAGMVDVYDYVLVDGRVWCDDCKFDQHGHVGAPEAYCGRCNRESDDEVHLVPVLH